MILRKYLERHAEPEARLADGLPLDADTAVVVPLLGEEPQPLWESLAVAARASGLRVLAVAVVNAGDRHPLEIHAANARTLEGTDALAGTAGPVFWRKHSPE